MKRYFVLFVLFIISVIGKAQSWDQVWYQNCRKNEIDCNYQIPGAKGDDCILHRLNVTTSLEGCRSQFIEQFPDVLDGTSDSTFDVESSFSKKNFCNPNSTACKNNSGLNITVRAGRGTRGVLFWISLAKENFCRAIHLKNSFKAENLPFLLWYDCMFFRNSEHGGEFKLNIITYPRVHERIFLGKIAVPEEFTSDRIESWKSPVFVETTSLKNKEVTIFFQEAYGTHNYSVFLRTNTSSGPVHHFYGVNGSSKNEPVIRSVDFKNLMTGQNYMAVVQPLDFVCQSQNQPNVTKCKESHSAKFTVLGHDNDNQSLGTWIAILCVLLGIPILVLVLIRVLRCYMRNTMSNGKKQKVLILYSYDNDVHNNLVDAFATLLKVNRISVCIDKQKTTEDPAKWLRDHIFEKDVKIIIILSKGALYKAIQDKPVGLKGEPGNLTSHLFAAGLNFIRNKITKGHWFPSAYLGVVWDNSKREEAKRVIPECKLFTLDKKSWPKFLCEIYYGHCLPPCMNFILPLIIDFGNDLEKCQVGKNFLEALKMMNKKGDFIRTFDDASDSESGGSIAAEENVEIPMPSMEPDKGYHSMNPSSMDSGGQELSVSAFPGIGVDVNRASADETVKMNKTDSDLDFLCSI